MPTVTMKSGDGNIECLYDGDVDKDNFFLTVPSGCFGFITVKVPVLEIGNLDIVTAKFREYIKIATGR